MLWTPARTRRVLLSVGVLAALLVAAVVPVAAAPAAQTTSCTQFYHVRYGDTLARTARHFGTTQAQLLALNPSIRNPNLIYAGLPLCVRGVTTAPPPPLPPPVTPPPPPPSTSLHYTVRRGDTLGGIARAYGTDAITLARFNGIANINLIFAGQVLRVPTSYGGPR